MPEQQQQARAQSGQFLFRKSIFLLSSSVGQTTAETLVKGAVHKIGGDPATLEPADIPELASILEPALSELVGNEKARKLASALRVLVGGTTGV